MSNSPDEWYSPLALVECARSAMGSITLDPFSSHEANSYVRADIYYTKDVDGLSKDWYGKVYLNPPFSIRKTEHILARALQYYRSEQIEELFIVLPRHYQNEILDDLKDEATAYHRITKPVRFLNSELNTYNERIDIYYFGARQRAAANAIARLENAG